MNRKPFRPILFFALIASAWLIETHSIFGKGTIVHFAGAPFSAGANTELDVNADGIPDFVFSSGIVVCTPSASSCASPYYVAGGTNELLGGEFAAVLRYGEAIGEQRADWLSATTLTTYHTGLDLALLTMDPYWLGGLGYGGLGYLGVRFHAADGLHYGWIRVRLPARYPDQIVPEASPVVMEWAYETRPAVPIQAGDDGEERTEFTIQFIYGNAIVQGENYSWGKALIGKNSLSYEIHLAGGEIPVGFTVEPSQPNRRILANIDFPYIHLQPPAVLLSDFTVLFGEIGLPHGQAIQVSRDRYDLKLNGTVIAEIIPSTP